MRVHISSGQIRKKPSRGDTKIICGVLHRRELMRDLWGRLVVTSRGDNRYIWVAIVEGVAHD